MEVRDNSGAVTARAFEVATSTIRREHQCVDAVMTALQQWLARVARGHAAPDFQFFSAVLYYIDDFPGRQHHPKEDDYLFKAIRRRTRLFDPERGVASRAYSAIPDVPRG